MEPIKMILLILPRGNAETVTQICLRHKVAFHLTLHGRGTAAADILELWGLEDTDRDVVLVCIPQSVRDGFIKEVTQRLELEKPGHGILQKRYKTVKPALAAQYAVFASVDQNPPQSGTIFTIIKKKHPKRPICSSTSTARFCQRFSKPSLCVNAKTMFGSMIVAIHKSPQPLNQRMRIPPFRIRF